jgi:acyl-CoA thioester hydrolase
MLNKDRQIFVVVSTNADFIAPARFNDELRVTAGLAGLTRASFAIDQEIYRGDELLLRSGVKAALLDADTLKPQRVPKSLFEGNENAS